MKGAVLALFGGFATAIGIAILAATKPGASILAPGVLDINKASAEDLVALGLDETMAARVVEYRPYRSRIELLERYVLGRPDFDLIRDHVGVDVAHAHDAVRVAS